MTDQRGSIPAASLTNLAVLLVLLRAGGYLPWLPWWVVLAPLWIVPAAAVIAVGCLAAIAVAWAVDEVNGAREKVARKRTTDRDWARWHQGGTG